MKPIVYRCIRKRCAGVVQNTHKGTFCKNCNAEYYFVDEDPRTRTSRKPQPLGWSK